MVSRSFQDSQSPDDIDFRVFNGAFDRSRISNGRSEMKYGVNLAHRIIDDDWIADIARNKPDLREWRKILTPSGRKVIEDRQVVRVIEQEFDQIRADEARPASN